MQPVRVRLFNRPSPHHHRHHAPPALGFATHGDWGALGTCSSCHDGQPLLMCVPEGATVEVLLREACAAMTRMCEQNGAQLYAEGARMGMCNTSGNGAGNGTVMGLDGSALSPIPQRAAGGGGGGDGSPLHHTRARGSTVPSSLLSPRGVGRFGAAAVPAGAGGGTAADSAARHAAGGGGAASASSWIPATPPPYYPSECQLGLDLSGLLGSEGPDAPHGGGMGATCAAVRSARHCVTDPFHGEVEILNHKRFVKDIARAWQAVAAAHTSNRKGGGAAVTPQFVLIPRAELRSARGKGGPYSTEAGHSPHQQRSTSAGLRPAAAAGGAHVRYVDFSETLRSTTPTNSNHNTRSVDTARRGATPRSLPQRRSASSALTRSGGGEASGHAAGGGGGGVAIVKERPHSERLLMTTASAKVAVGGVVGGAPSTGTTAITPSRPSTLGQASSPSQPSVWDRRAPTANALPASGVVSKAMREQRAAATDPQTLGRLVLSELRYYWSRMAEKKLRRMGWRGEERADAPSPASDGKDRHASRDANAKYSGGAKAEESPLDLGAVPMSVLSQVPLKESELTRLVGKASATLPLYVAASHYLPMRTLADGAYLLAKSPSLVMANGKQPTDATSAPPIAIGGVPPSAVVNPSQHDLFGVMVPSPSTCTASSASGGGGGVWSPQQRRLIALGYRRAEIARLTTVCEGRVLTDKSMAAKRRWAMIRRLLWEHVVGRQPTAPEAAATSPPSPPHRPSASSALPTQLPPPLAAEYSVGSMGGGGRSSSSFSPSSYNGSFALGGGGGVGGDRGDGIDARTNRSHSTVGSGGFHSPFSSHSPTTTANAAANAAEPLDLPLSIRAQKALLRQECLLFRGEWCPIVPSTRRVPVADGGGGAHPHQRQQPSGRCHVCDGLPNDHPYVIEPLPRYRERLLGEFARRELAGGTEMGAGRNGAAPPMGSDAVGAVAFGGRLADQLIAEGHQEAATVKRLQERLAYHKGRGAAGGGGAHRANSSSARGGGGDGSGVGLRFDPTHFSSPYSDRHRREGLLNIMADDKGHPQGGGGGGSPSTASSRRVGGGAATPLHTAARSMSRGGQCCRFGVSARAEYGDVDLPPPSTPSPQQQKGPSAAGGGALAPASHAASHHHRSCDNFIPKWGQNYICANCYTPEDAHTYLVALRREAYAQQRAAVRQGRSARSAHAFLRSKRMPWPGVLAYLGLRDIVAVAHVSAHMRRVALPLLTATLREVQQHSPTEGRTAVMMNVDGIAAALLNPLNHVPAAVHHHYSMSGDQSSAEGSSPSPSFTTTGPLVSPAYHSISTLPDSARRMNARLSEALQLLVSTCCATMAHHHGGMAALGLATTGGGGGGGGGGDIVPSAPSPPLLVGGSLQQRMTVLVRRMSWDDVTAEVLALIAAIEEDVVRWHDGFVSQMAEEGGGGVAGRRSASSVIDVPTASAAFAGGGRPNSPPPSPVADLDMIRRKMEILRQKRSQQTAPATPTHGRPLPSAASAAVVVGGGVLPASKRSASSSSHHHRQQQQQQQQVYRDIIHTLYPFGLINPSLETLLGFFLMLAKEFKVKCFAERFLSSL